MWNETALTKLLQIEWPIIQGPFGSGLSSVNLTAAVSNAGGLGSFGAHHLPPQAIVEAVAQIRGQTSKPFALNLWVSNQDAALDRMTDADFLRFAEALRPAYESLGLALPQRPEKFGERFEQQIEAVLEARPAVFSFVFGIPSREILRELRQRNIRTLGAGVTPEEVLALEEAGVDAIVASGFEAGGHRVAFLRPAEESLYGTLSLVSLATARVRAPIIAAGGIASGRGIAAALTLGASGAQIGTAFLACEESNASAPHKKILRSGELRRTALTKAFSGRLARGLVNELMQTLEKNLAGIAPYPVQGWLLQQFKSAAIAQDRSDLLSFWAGQSFPLIRHTSAAELMASLISETNETLRR